MIASIKDDFTVFESIKKKTEPQYKETWVELKDEVIFFSSTIIFLPALVLIRKITALLKLMNMIKRMFGNYHFNHDESWNACNLKSG